MAPLIHWRNEFGAAQESAQPSRGAGGNQAGGRALGCAWVEGRPLGAVPVNLALGQNAAGNGPLNP